MGEKSHKLYVYVDETGQDTRGTFFLVAVVVLGQERESISKKLLDIEDKSLKRNAKWHKSRHEYRVRYIEALCDIRSLSGKIFYEVSYNHQKYIELSSHAAAMAILRQALSKYKALVFVDGFNRREMAIFRSGLREMQIRTKKISSVKKDESNEFIRLADALCGVVRDAQEGNIWSQKMLGKLKTREIITEL